ncbi:MAG: flagellar basal body rod protein FlgB [Mariprofundaceae bacterium]|nr:flagellar basal body rod protein FlgB [Mariprofundaceae bacterium]
MTQSLFGAGILRLESAMSARERVQSVYAANIANADTPNYRADMRTFSDFMAEKSAASGSTAMARTNPAHLQPHKSSVPLGGGVFNRASVAARMDGNTVDTQREMTAMAENQMMHELNMTILKGRLSGLANVIKEGGR